MHRSSSIIYFSISRNSRACFSLARQVSKESPSSAHCIRIWEFLAIVCILALILRCSFFTVTAHIKSRQSRNNILIGCMEKPHHVSFLFVLAMPLRSLCLRAVLSMCCCVICAREFGLHVCSAYSLCFVCTAATAIRLNVRPEAETVTKRGGDLASNNNKPRPNDMLVTIYVLFVTHVFFKRMKSMRQSTKLEKRAVNSFSWHETHTYI